MKIVGWYLILMMWTVPNVEEEKAQYSGATLFDTYQECVDAYRKVVETMPEPVLRHRANLAYFPVTN